MPKKFKAKHIPNGEEFVIFLFNKGAPIIEYNRSLCLPTICLYLKNLQTCKLLDLVKNSVKLLDIRSIHANHFCYLSVTKIQNVFF